MPRTIRSGNNENAHAQSFESLPRPSTRGIRIAQHDHVTTAAINPFTVTRPSECGQSITIIITIRDRRIVANAFRAPAIHQLTSAPEEGSRDKCNRSFSNTYGKYLAHPTRLYVPPCSSTCPYPNRRWYWPAGRGPTTSICGFSRARYAAILIVEVVFPPAFDSPT